MDKRDNYIGNRRNCNVKKKCIKPENSPWIKENLQKKENLPWTWRNYFKISKIYDESRSIYNGNFRNYNITSRINKRNRRI